MSAHPVLFYDGDCAMCSRAVRFVLAADRTSQIFVAPLGGTTAADYAHQHPMLGRVNSLVFVEGAHASIRSDGALAVLRTMGGVWRALAWVASWVPAGWRNRLYDAVATRRQRWSASLGPCPLPPAHQRHRVLP